MMPSCWLGDLPVLGGFVGIEQHVIPGQGVGGGRECAEGNEEFERVMAVAFIGVVCVL